MEINYLEILKKAWAVTWANKYLWWFGFFIALTSSGSFLNYSTSHSDKTDQLSRQFSALTSAHPSLTVFGMLVALVIVVILLIMRLLSRGALIKSIEKNSKGKNSNFSSGLRDGRKYFWKIFLIYFLIQAVLVAVVLLMLTPVVFLFMTKSYILGILLTLAAIIIIVPLAILAFFLENYGAIYLVLGDLSLLDAIENSYSLFRKNIWTSILMGLIFIPIIVVLGLVLLFTLFLLAVIFFIIGVVFWLIFSKIGAAFILALAILAFLAIFLGVRSIYETFYQAVWIFFFHEIAKPKVEEKVMEAEEEIIPEINPETTPDAA